MSEKETVRRVLDAVKASGRSALTAPEAKEYGLIDEVISSPTVEA